MASLTASHNYEKFFMHAPVGLCVTSHRIIQTSNQAVATMFGYLTNELNSQSLLVLYPSQDEFERIGARILPVLQASGAYADDRIMKRANGELFWCHVRGITLNPDDPFALAIWSFEDLSGSRMVSIKLTAREREIAAQLVTGASSKKIGRTLDLSPRTVEMYRAKLMHKYQASSVTELVQKLLTTTS